MTLTVEVENISHFLPVVVVVVAAVVLFVFMFVPSRTSSFVSFSGVGGKSKQTVCCTFRLRNMQMSCLFELPTCLVVLRPQVG